MFLSFSVLFNDHLEVENLVSGSNSGSKTGLSFINFFMHFNFNSVSHHLEEDFAAVADQSNGSVVAILLERALPQACCQVV